MSISLPRIAVTTGDPAGIGPEVCLHLLNNQEIARICTPVVFGDLSVLKRASEESGLAMPESVVSQLEDAEGPCLLNFESISQEDLSLIHI